jgi:hypothetical protein
MQKLRLAGIGLALFAVGALLASTAVATAHERRAVQEYTFVVGWLTEPALLNQPNSIDLRVTRTADASAVTGLEQTVKAEVSQGSTKANVDLRPRFNTPGAYNGYLMPTVAGVYSFKFTGTIEGKQLDQTFTSGPSTFGSIEEPNTFPVELASNQALDESVQSLEERIVALESDSDDSGTAMTVAIAGVVIGLVGLGVGAYGFTRKSA